MALGPPKDIFLHSASSVFQAPGEASVYMPCTSNVPYLHSPLYKPNDDPDKKFIPGYSGWVPRLSKQFGMTFPKATHVALNEFTDDIKHQAHGSGLLHVHATPQHATHVPRQPAAHVQIERLVDAGLHEQKVSGQDRIPAALYPHVIYQPTCGIIPRYSGFVPGTKFQFGQRYGVMTFDALKRGKVIPVMLEVPVNSMLAPHPLQSTVPPVQSATGTNFQPRASKQVATMVSN